MNLSLRLKAVADMVGHSKVTADIGCDHAHVAIYLIENNISEKVIACDVNKGPLDHARSNVQNVMLEDKIDLRLSDGLAAICEGEADTVIVAGMGGNLMMKIIAEGQDKLGDDARMILQPQSEVCAFRHFLKDNGFATIDENFIYEDGKFYPILMVKRCEDTDDTDNCTSECDFRYGKHLLDNNNQTLLDYLKREQVQFKQIIEELKEQGISKRSSERVVEVEKLIELNQEALRRFHEV